MKTNSVNRNKIKMLLEHELKTMKKDALCKALEIAPASLHNYLFELTNPNTNTLQKICDYFRIPMTDLLTNQLYDSSPDSVMTNDEMEVIMLYRSLNETDKNTIKAQLRFFTFESQQKRHNNSTGERNDQPFSQQSRGEH